MIKVGITAGESVIAAELIRILINHPDVELKWVESHELHDTPVQLYHKGLIGELDMNFSQAGALNEIDLLFAGEALPPSLPPKLMVIDLLSKHRLEDGDWILGIPEVNRRRIVHDCTRIALPSVGAYATSLALLPLAKHLMLNGEINVTSVIDANVPDENPSDELRLVLDRLQANSNYRLNFRRTIDDRATRKCVTTVTLNCNTDIDLVTKLYIDYYDDHNLTHVASRAVDERDVTNTAKALITVGRDEDNLLKIIVAFDPRLKGGAGLAIHNMNLLCGLHERIGLQLKAYV